MGVGRRDLLAQLRGKQPPDYGPLQVLRIEKRFSLEMAPANVRVRCAYSALQTFSRATGWFTDQCRDPLQPHCLGHMLD